MTCVGLLVSVACSVLGAGPLAAHSLLPSPLVPACLLRRCTTTASPSLWGGCLAKRRPWGPTL